MPDAQNRSALLDSAYVDQRAELSYRRAREGEVFLWSSAVLLAIIGALLVARPEHRALLRAGYFAGAGVASAVVLFISGASVLWQHKQRVHAALNQRVLARIADERGLFKPIDERPALFTTGWRDWGSRSVAFSAQLKEPSRILATLLLGFAALVSVVLAVVVSA